MDCGESKWTTINIVIVAGQCAASLPESKLFVCVCGK